MLGKAIRKAVLPILLASLMVGTGCRIVYGKADISLNERAENHTSDNTAASPEEQEKTTEPAAPDDALVQAPSALLMEASTGTVIYEKDSDTRRSPASITKIMTLILIFDALENGTLASFPEAITMHLIIISTSWVSPSSRNTWEPPIDFA